MLPLPRFLGFRDRGREERGQFGVVRAVKCLGCLAQDGAVDLFRVGGKPNQHAVAGHCVFVVVTGHAVPGVAPVVLTGEPLV